MLVRRPAAVSAARSMDKKISFVKRYYSEQKSWKERTTCRWLLHETLVTLNIAPFISTFHILHYCKILHYIPLLHYLSTIQLLQNIALFHYCTIPLLQKYCTIPLFCTVALFHILHYILHHILLPYFPLSIFRELNNYHSRKWVVVITGQRF